MDKRLILLLLLLTIVVVYKVSSQENYWIALNFEVEIRGDGVALVRAKLHPFSPEGKSLYGNKTIEAQLKEGEEIIVEELLLMFTNDPSKLDYKVITGLSPHDEYVVYCDIENVGRMTPMQGAYIVEVMIYLNTSEFVKKIDESVYQISIRDSYTSRDPRSWIDILIVEFSKGAVLLNFSWVPASAHGPYEKKEDRLMWVNYNEIQAPDYYVFTVKIPELKMVEVPVLTGKITNVSFKAGELKVTIENNSSRSGYFYVRIFAGKVEQSVKVYVREKSTSTAAVPLKNIKANVVKVELWSDNVRLDSVSIKAEGATESPEVEKKAFPLFKVLKIVALTVVVIGLAIVVYGVLLKEEKKAPYYPPPPPPPFTQ
ncbi:MAG: hypothetical protein DRJ63_03540 [Thermoprotei archaeon]|nr:MAG: hypothetical protein DRJ63_03540 [Thermoprotei archaeon]